MWRSYHVHYYDDDTSGLVLDAIQPFVERIAPHVDAVYHVPHWLRGPHVRINVDASPAVTDAVVRPALDDCVGRYLTERPSRAVVDADTMLAQHTRLAELEHEDGAIAPLRPDNSIHEGDYDQRLHVLGGKPAARLLADFYSATTPLAFDMLAHLRDGGQRVGLAFDLMVATAHGLSGIGLHRGFVSFRSHAEAFLSWWPEAEGLRQAWDRHYAVHAGALTARVRAVTAAVDAGAAGPRFVRPWLDALRPFGVRGGELISSGALSMNPPWANRYSDDDEVITELARKSPFHNRERPAGEEIDEVWFSQYKLMLNYTYLHLTRVGLSPVERFLLCHLAANAVEEIYGIPATEVRLPGPSEHVRISE